MDGVESTGAEVYYTTRWLNGALIQADESLIEAIEALGYVDSVVYVAPGVRLTKNSRKWEAFEESPPAQTSTQLQMLGVDALHGEGYHGEGVTVAFFDGGFVGVNNVTAFQHIFFDNRMKYAFNLVENSQDVFKSSNHGTKVFSATAGLMAGQFTGTAYGADFMLFITEDAASEYRIEEYNWLIAAEKADSAGVDIISSSVGYFDFDDPSMNYSYEDMDGKTTIVAQAAKMASERGILIVASAGNEGNKSWRYITTPADVESILAVGSVNSTGEVSSFSSRGPTADGRVKPDVMALGSGTTVINESGMISKGTGTSFAAPLITGLAAGIWQAYPELTNYELMDLIKSIGSHADIPDNSYGHGIPDYTLLATPDPGSLSFSVFPNPVAIEDLKIKSCCRQETTAEARVIDATGKVVKHLLFNFARNQNQHRLYVDDLRQGLYLLVLRSSTGTEMHRIVKY
ncbi:putative exported serine protease, subtilase family protein [Fulvivirga imtechensis AK7]|uniref:Putative exported serine protease, subtilase family protein n=1 Tax=Fulvivirga imtechensis AK7 TaxID=1237149 RepID=L8JY32_9BACT|nr:putative exported serine protease, subtilase family protein [Fulvivirga imtechensis AK7]